MTIFVLKQRRDKSPLTNEELYPFSVRADELNSLFLNGEVSTDEITIRAERFIMNFLG